jgi:hypothetical protein
VIYVVYDPTAVTDIDECLQYSDDVILGENA